MREQLPFSEQRRPAVRDALRALFALLANAEDSSVAPEAVGRLGRWVMNAAVAVRQAAEATRPSTDLRRARRLLAGVLEMAELLCLTRKIDDQLLYDVTRQINRIVEALEDLPQSIEEWPLVPLPPLEAEPDENSGEAAEEAARPLREIRESAQRIIRIRAAARWKKSGTKTAGRSAPATSTDTSEKGADSPKPPSRSSG